METDRLKEKLQNELTPILTGVDAYLVELIIATDKDKKHIHIYVDTDHGITLDQCSKISKAVDPIIEEWEEFQHPYTLEVSSPGLSRPIVHKRQYKRLINKTLNISYTDPDGTKRNEDFVLSKIENDTFTFNNNKKEISLNFNNIEHAKLRLAW